MDHHLPPHIRFAFLGGGAVLLDIEADRYLMLRGAEVGVLEALGAGLTTAAIEPALGRLSRRRLIGDGPGPSIAPISAPIATSSALELAGPSQRAGALEIARYRLDAALRLRLRGLGQTIAQWRRLKNNLLTAETMVDRRHACAVARGYAAARVQLPWRRLCVPDSLALARYLWQRGIPGQVYFGVRLDPFAAHAWVQHNEMVLSDNVNVVADYTPVFRL